MKKAHWPGMPHTISEKPDKPLIRTKRSVVSNFGTGASAPLAVVVQQQRGSPGQHSDNLAGRRGILPNVHGYP
jgi:hypothetical protein